MPGKHFIAPQAARHYVYYIKLSSPYEVGSKDEQISEIIA